MMQYVINTAFVVISDRFVDTGKICTSFLFGRDISQNFSVLANLPDLTPVGKPK